MRKNDDVLAAVRHRYGRDLVILAGEAFGPSGSADVLGHPNESRRIPSIIRHSILKRSVDVKLVVSHRLVVRSTSLSGPYPEGAILVATSVSARRARTNASTSLDLSEIDAWGVALAPTGFEDFVLKLGEMRAYASGARHFRYVLGPDRNICVLSRADREALRAIHEAPSIHLRNQR